MESREVLSDEKAEVSLPSMAKDYLQRSDERGRLADTMSVPSGDHEKVDRDQVNDTYLIVNCELGQPGREQPRDSATDNPYLGVLGSRTPQTSRQLITMNLNTPLI